MSNKYRKKAVEIEAFKYDGDLSDKSGNYYVPNWAVEAFNNRTMFFDSLDSDSPPCELFIKTLEGVHHVSVGDYIIRGVQGELYPCKSDIFEETYSDCNYMKFGIALELLKKGCKVARAGWNGKNQYLFLVDGISLEYHTKADLSSLENQEIKHSDVIAIKTSSGIIQVGWLASQTDMMADDWSIVE